MIDWEVDIHLQKLFPHKNFAPRTSLGRSMACVLIQSMSFTSPSPGHSDPEM